MTVREALGHLGCILGVSSCDLLPSPQAASHVRCQGKIVPPSESAQPQATIVGGNSRDEHPPCLQCFLVSMALCTGVSGHSLYCAFLATPKPPINTQRFLILWSGAWAGAGMLRTKIWLDEK